MLLKKKFAHILDLSRNAHADWSRDAHADWCDLDPPQKYCNTKNSTEFRLVTYKRKGNSVICCLYLYLGVIHALTPPYQKFR